MVLLYKTKQYSLSESGKYWSVMDADLFSGLPTQRNLWAFAITDRLLSLRLSICKLHILIIYICTGPITT